MRIFGLNIASNANMPNRRGAVDPDTGRFEYLPIVEDKTLSTPAPTYRSLGFDRVAEPDLPVHLDPEFETNTYGHVKRFGDQILWSLQPGDLLFFYATLDLAPQRTNWALFIVGYLEVAESVDASGKPLEDLKQMDAFRANAHLKRHDPSVSLLIKGTARSRLFSTARPLSEIDNPYSIHDDLLGQLTTVTGKPVRGGSGWWRWLLYSEHPSLRKKLLGHI